MMNKPTLILGASLTPYKPSGQAVEMLEERGHKVYAIGKEPGFIGKTEVKTQMDSIPFPEIHTLGLYLNPLNQKQFENWILELKPKRIFFNPGTYNPEFEKRALDAGIECRNECMLTSMGNGLY